MLLLLYNNTIAQLRTGREESLVFEIETSIKQRGIESTLLFQHGTGLYYKECSR